jgi:hypothetical protein
MTNKSVSFNLSEVIREYRKSHRGVSAKKCLGGNQEDPSVAKDQRGHVQIDVL